MPRTWDADLQTIFEAYKRRDKLVINKSDGTTLSLSRGNISGCSNWIRSVSDVSSTIDRPVDRVSFDIQNVNSTAGLVLADDLRLLSYATAEYSRQYQSLRNPSLVQTISFFRGVIADAEADEEHLRLDLVVDYQSVGSILASRSLGPVCWWPYKNGVECTSASSETTCPRTRSGCVKRSVEHQFGGWEFFENPVAQVPGTRGTGIGIGYCFTRDTKVWLPSGDIPIGDLPLGRPSTPIPVVSFDPERAEICEDDEIENVWEHDADGYLRFEFDNGIGVNVTPEHKIWVGMFRPFRAARDFKLHDHGISWPVDQWRATKLIKIEWHQRPVKVRNITTRKNHTYFANRLAVSNSKEVTVDDPI